MFIEKSFLFFKLDLNRKFKRNEIVDYGLDKKAL